MIRYTLTLMLLFACATFSLSAQDSLRLTLKLEGFKEKDKLLIAFSEGTYNLPTEKEELTVVRKLEAPESMAIYYKSRYQLFWADNNDINVTISKSGFKKGLDVQGSPSEDLWQKIVKAPKEERAKLLEENINTKMAQAYLASRSNKLLPKDKERLLALSNAETNDLAKYDVSMARNISNTLKEGDQMMDFFASTIDGQETSTEDLRGKYILLDFAGTSCGWCWVEYPAMSQSLVKYQNLQTLTFNIDFRHEDWQKTADRREIDLPWPVLWKAENKQEIINRYGIDVLPTYYLISPDGIILERWQAGKVEKTIRKLKRYGVE
ncbi:TlpA family protein disulfide reductase [Roseivirga pacifica]|uniref:TlpA family protein disulfide reductase n=1 Tax=Roseivirga pacifica TaxID=1267423 RepID=UPI00227C19CD|nr:TlpA disulfide reductase family protein [Roseivirga pacifica]